LLGTERRAARRSWAPDRVGNIDQEDALSRIHYFADGYLLEADGTNRQSTWVCMFNPTQRDAELAFTFYYEDAEPTAMCHEVAASKSVNLHLLGCEQVLRDRRFGAKIESSEPMVIQITTGYYGVADRADWYTRGMHSVICSDHLSTLNYYADGLVIDQPGQRLKEPEWAFILNPNPVAAEVELHTCYSDGGRRTYPLRVAPARVLSVFMDELVDRNRLFGARYVSSVPVAVQQTRLIVEEDRETIRSCYSVMAKPGPLVWQDDEELERVK
jgi:hypothetical protein